MSYVRQNKVLFRIQRSGISRCFPITVYPMEHLPQYQSLLSISKLKIKFKITSIFNRLFLLTDGENFNRKSFCYSGQTAFRKNIMQRSKSNRKERCVSYRESYPQLNCASRPECVDKCAHRKFVKTHHNISIGFVKSFDYPSTVIDKGLFGGYEWKTSFPVEETDLNILNECKEEIANLRPCIETKFEKSVTINQPDRHVSEIDLFYEVIR